MTSHLRLVGRRVTEFRDADAIYDTISETGPDLPDDLPLIPTRLPSLGVVTDTRRDDTTGRVLPLRPRASSPARGAAVDFDDGPRAA